MNGGQRAEPRCLEPKGERRTMTIRTWLVSIAVVALAGCAADETLPSEDPEATAGDASIHPSPTVQDRASASVQRVGTALEECPGCGPVPDPWRDLFGPYAPQEGPVPDPWVPKPTELTGADGKKRP